MQILQFFEFFQEFLKYSITMHFEDIFNKRIPIPGLPPLPKRQGETNKMKLKVYIGQF